MSANRVLVAAPVFFFSLTVGIAVFSVAADVASYLGTDQIPDAKVQALSLPTSSVQPPDLGPLDPQLADRSKDESDAEEATKDQVPEYEWSGVYAFDTESLPKAFRGLGYMEVNLYDVEKIGEDGEPGVRIPPKGYLLAETEFKFKRIAVAGKHISFQTETVNGVSYRFTGEYLALDYCETGGATPDVSGELIKIVNGRWAAAMKAKLYEECGC
ncbi:MAG: hypothetical protein IT174_08195 [Acidobacteria bacterium]|nr:hypothetical protein [Acidobacteriota bacterium]